MYLVDTNVVSELGKPESRLDRAVADWAASVQSVSLYISVITLLEIRIGILRVALRDEAKARKLQRWFERQVIVEFAGRTLPFDAAAARLCAPLHVPDPFPERDGLIAATALSHDYTVVTRNVRDFRKATVRVLDPWAFRG